MLVLVAAPQSAGYWICNVRVFNISQSRLNRTKVSIYRKKEMTGKKRSWNWQVRNPFGIAHNILCISSKRKLYFIERKSDELDDIDVCNRILYQHQTECHNTICTSTIIISPLQKYHLTPSFFPFYRFCLVGIVNCERWTRNGAYCISGYCMWCWYIWEPYKSEHGVRSFVLFGFDDTHITYLLRVSV